MWILLVYNVCSHFLLDCVAILFIFHAISQSFFSPIQNCSRQGIFVGSLRLHVLLSSRIFQFRQTNIFWFTKETRSEKKTKLKVGIKCVHKSKFMFGFVIISNLFVITIKSDRNMQFFLSFCSVFCRFRSSPNAPHTAMAPVCWCCMYFAHETQLEFYGKLFCQNGFIQIFMCFLVLFIRSFCEWTKNLEHIKPKRIAFANIEMNLIRFCLLTLSLSDLPLI